MPAATRELPEYARRMISFKARRVARHGPGPDGWMPPVAIAYRGGRRRCTAVAPHCNKDLGLVACATLRAGFGADRIVFCSDAFATFGDESDIDRWKPGDMQALHAAGATLENDGLGQALFLLAADADGRVQGLHLPYRLDGRRVRWLEPSVLDGELGGDLPDSLKHILQTRPLADFPRVQAAGRKFGITAVHRQCRLIEDATKAALEQKGFTVILGEGRT